MDWTCILKCLRCNARGLTLNATASDELLREHGKAICNQCGRRFPTRDHIFDLSQCDDASLLTEAGSTNCLPLLPWGHEKVWRPRSLTMLSGE
jgi:uncharacterized protein YbaR (Trm112 family)